MDIAIGVELLVSGKKTVEKWERRTESMSGITLEGMKSGFCEKSGRAVEFVVTDKAAGSC